MRGDTLRYVTLRYSTVSIAKWMEWNEMKWNEIIRRRVCCQKRKARCRTPEWRTWDTRNPSWSGRWTCARIASQCSPLQIKSILHSTRNILELVNTILIYFLYIILCLYYITNSNRYSKCIRISSTNICIMNSL